MKTPIRTCGLIALSLAGACSHALLAATPYSTAIMPGYDHSSAELGFSLLSDDATRPGRYTGPTEQGIQPILNLDLRYKDENNDARYGHLLLKELGSDNTWLRGRYGVQGDYSLGIEYRARPLFQYQNLESPLTGNRLQLPDLMPGVPVTSNLQRWDIDQKRESVRLSGQKIIDNQWRLNLVINRENKSGRRLQGYGSWFDRNGFQMPAPIDQRTDQFDLGVEYTGPRLQARVGYHLSQFQQLNGLALTAHNPHSTDLGNPETLQLSLPPDNSYHQLSGALAYTLSNDTRFSGELNLGRAMQDDRFIQDNRYQDVLDALGIDSLDGQLDTTRLGLRATHRLNPAIQFRASYRYDDRDNTTSTHQNLESEYGNLRNTRAHGWTRHTFDTDANIRLPARSTLLVGIRHDDIDRKTGARGETQETTFRTRLRSRINDKVNTGLKLSYAELVGSTYDDTITSNHEALRKYHLASVDKTRLAANTSWNAMEQLALGIELTFRKDDYALSELGLQEDQRFATTLTADWFPSRTLSGYAFFTYENGERLLAGINERLNQDTTTLSLGLGFKARLTEDERYSLGADLLLVNSDTGIHARSGDSFPDLESRLAELRLYGNYRANENLSFRLAWLAQHFKETDWALGYGATNPPTTTDYLLMGASEYNQTVHLIVGSVAWHF